MKKQNNLTKLHEKIYIPVKYKFLIALVITFFWGVFSVVISQIWHNDLAKIVGGFWAYLIIWGIAIIPGCLNAFLVTCLLLDRKIPLKESNIDDAITILVAAYNEEKGIYATLEYIANQEFRGNIRVIVINNNSTDYTAQEVFRAKNDFNMNLECITERTPGKHFALNTALPLVETELVITLDADTLLHKYAIKHLIGRMKMAPDNTAAVAGSMLVRNSRENMLARMQEWDYFLSIASIKRMQGLLQGTLVAQGAFSVYKTEKIREVGGWPDVIGEDIVVTWRLLEKGQRVFFEPTAVAFTDVPTQTSHFVKQRARWARGMIEALKSVKPWEQPMMFTKFSTGIDLFIPFIDFSYTFFWIPGLFLALVFHKYYIVGPMTLLVYPLNFLSFYILYRYQKKHVFEPLGLSIRKNKWGLIMFLLTYQFLMSPISLYGYIQELFQMKRVWK